MTSVPVTVTPVSAGTRRTTAAAGDSPAKISPPANVHGGMPSWRRSMRTPRSLVTIARATTGGSGSVPGSVIGSPFSCPALTSWAALALEMSSMTPSWLSDSWPSSTMRAELNRLVASTAFRNSKRCSEFLEYVVEHTIGGKSGALKERSLGVDLFHLPQDFDSGQHTVVRVTANEVRKRLAQHYLAENGSQHPVRISLPPGSYSAEFKWETRVTEAQAPSRPTRPAGWMIACSVAVLAILGAVFPGRWHVTKPISTGTSSAPGTVRSALPAGEDLRIGVGTASPYVDRSGRTWSPDRFFSGGSVFTRPSERVLRTLDPDLYRRSRQGDFRYDIPLKPGSYELHLHFAET